MTVHYLDASAWVKRYHTELGTRWVANLFATAPMAACASLGVVEVTAALTRLARAQPIPPRELPLRLAAVRADWAHMIQVQLTDQVLQEAIRQAKQRALRGADAIHLASALVLDKSLSPSGEVTILVTSDRELAEAAGETGLAVLNPEALESLS